MLYKVFFVEDEVVTREGIRDNVDWKTCGFEFCGEASDGEMALPLLRATQPDVLITDIKMPFMDGLQLSKIVRERMPHVKIVILSGHDEFEYAQEAINLGVTNYLLKPVTAQKLQATLHKLAAQLDEEKREQANLEKLQEQVQENQTALRERLLLKLVMGAITPSEAIECGNLLNLDLSARYYLVVMLKIELRDRSEAFDYAEYARVQEHLASLAENDPDIFLLKKDFEDLVLIMKGSTPEYLEEQRDLFLEEIGREVAKTRYKLNVGIGPTQKRIADISQSFVDALVNLRQQGDEPQSAATRAGLFALDRLAVENYLHSGTRDGFDEFFRAYLQPIGEVALKSSLVRNYIFMDVVLATAKLVKALNGDIERVIPALGSVEALLANIKTLEELRAQVRNILGSALAFRDGQSSRQYKNLVWQAKAYIEKHFANPELSLGDVAALVSLSVSHFSVVFSQETGQTFKEYLTETRIQKAKELLRTTGLKSADIAYQVGYHDPHYFSAVFKKNTGLSPIEFRAQGSE